MNPFAAPQHDSPPPVDTSPKQRLLAAIGIVEMVGGAGLTLLALIVGLTQWNEMRAKAVGVEPWAMVFAVLIFITAGVFCVVAGYTLTRRASKRALLLQLVPALVSAFFILLSAFR